MNHLTKDELLPILRVAHKRNKLHWLAFLVSYWHGLRASEVTEGESVIKGVKVHHEGLIREDFIIGEKNSYIIVDRLKGSLRTAQPLVSHVEPLLSEREPLEALIKSLQEGERLFPFTRQWLWKLFKNYGKEAGVPLFKCHPHVMKHSIAMHTIKPLGIENVRQLLGHTDISSTGEYLKVSDQVATGALAIAIAAGNL